MKKKENQRIALTKRLLKESLLELMSQKNIQKISVSELCLAAGINRTTFYNHYGSQFDLLQDIKLDMIEDLDHLWNDETPGQDWSLKSRAEALCIYFREHERVAKLLLGDNDPNFEFTSLLAHSPNMQKAYQETLSDLADPDSRKLALTFFINGIYSLIRQWLLEDIPKTPKEMSELIYRISILDWQFTAHGRNSKPIR